MSAMRLLPLVVLFLLLGWTVRAEKPDDRPRTMIDGSGPGWVALKGEDFTNVNCYENTWKWDGDACLCSGSPVGVCRTKKTYTNFELVLQWRHQKKGGNSGVFVWTPGLVLEKLKPNQLPSGIEVQVLDHDYAVQYEKQTKKKPDWFTTNGDVFPVGGSKMKPFPPVSPDGSRSFPRKNTTKGVMEWNHYYIRAINGEIRLWVNGEEVSGGKDCTPRTGYICLESEGSPIDFRGIRIRELPLTDPGKPR